MRYLIFSDAHGHLSAVKELQEKAKSLKVDRIIFLGDSIGSGKDSESVVNLLRPWVDTWVTGNHEWEEIQGFNSKYSSNLLNLSKDNMEFFQTLPLSHKERNLCFSHADPRFEWFTYLYVDSLKEKDEYFYTPPLGRESAYYVEPRKTPYLWEWMEENQVKICFMGHTHVPGVCIKFDKGVFKYSNKNVTFNNTDLVCVNVGSCATPRENRDTTFVVLDTEVNEIAFHTLKYKFVKPRLALPSKSASNLPEKYPEFDWSEWEKEYKKEKNLFGEDHNPEDYRYLFSK